MAELSAVNFSALEPLQTSRNSPYFDIISWIVLYSFSTFSADFSFSRRSSKSRNSPWILICFWIVRSSFDCLLIVSITCTYFSSRNLWRVCCAIVKSEGKLMLLRNWKLSCLSISWLSSEPFVLDTGELQSLWESSDPALWRLAVFSKADFPDKLLPSISITSLWQLCASMFLGINELFGELFFRAFPSFTLNSIDANFRLSRAKISPCFSQTSLCETTHVRLVTACGLESHSL